jgi:hypothetical protein
LVTSCVLADREHGSTPVAARSWAGTDADLPRSALAAAEGWKAEARAARRNLDATTVAIALEL